MRSEIVVQRRFPTYDFVVRSALPSEQVMAIVSGAIIAPRWRFSLMPSRQLVGQVEGHTFKCRPETSAFGGNAVPLIRGEVIPRADGGTDVLVRAIDWFIYIVPGFFIILSVYFMLFSQTVEERWGGVKMFAEISLMATILYAIEMFRVRRLFEQVFA